MTGAWCYGFKGAGIGERARQQGSVVRRPASGEGRWEQVPAGVSYQVRCAGWVRSVGTEWFRVVASIETGTFGR